MEHTWSAGGPRRHKRHLGRGSERASTADALDHGYYHHADKATSCVREKEHKLKGLTKMRTSAKKSFEHNIYDLYFAHYNQGSSNALHMP